MLPTPEQQSSPENLVDEFNSYLTSALRIRNMRLIDRESMNEASEDAWHKF